MININRTFGLSSIIRIIFEAFIIGFSLYIAWFIRVESGIMKVGLFTLTFNEYMKVQWLIVPLFLLIYIFFNMYSYHRTKNILQEMVDIIKANSIGVSVFFVYLFMLKIIDYSRIVILLFFIIVNILIFLERQIVNKIELIYLNSDENMRNVVFVGYSKATIEYYHRIVMNPHWRYKVCALFCEEQREVKLLDDIDYGYLGNIEELSLYIENNVVDEVVLALNINEYKQLEKLVEICESYGVYTRIIPDYSNIFQSKPSIENIDGLPVIGIRNIPLNNYLWKILKRIFDILGSIIGIVLLMPLFIAVGIFIKFETKGAIIFTQERVGLNRKTFMMYKFKTMKEQSPEKEKNGWTKKGDTRVTRFGAFLRRTSIDEFPQLVNVLKGDMSLIGPRPERPQFVEKFKDEIPKYMVKHQVRPGISGWAQVNGLRGDTSITERIKYDLYYIENWSIKLEIKIFFLTFVKGFLNKNAY